MKKMEGVVRICKLGDVMKELSKADFDRVTVSEVIELGGQNGHSGVSKVRVEVMVQDSDVIRVRRIIIEAAHTGSPGDGHITISPAEHFIDISTGRDEAMTRAR